MGTRGLTMVMQDDKYKVAQYGQWDHYPEGQGVAILEFLRGADMSVFRQKVAKCTPITQEQLEKALREADAYNESGFITMEASDRIAKRAPHLHRDAGAKILDLVLNSENGLALHLEEKFVADSLFCEWAYVIDLDINTFEVYSGFNHNPLHPRDRFYKYSGLCRASASGDMYYPVALEAAFSLSRLPTEEVFLAIFKESD